MLQGAVARGSARALILVVMGWLLSSGVTMPQTALAATAPTITSPASYSWRSTATITFAGTADPGAAVDLYDGGAIVGSATASSNRVWTATVVGLSDGDHLIRVRSRATDGSTAWSGYSVVRIDTRPPAPPVITSPEEGATTGRSVTVTGIAESSTTLELRLDGVAGGTFVPTGSTWSRSLSGLSEGEHALAVRAHDMAGNASAWSAVRTIHVSSGSTTSPPNTILSPPSTGTTATFSFSADQANATFQCRLDRPTGPGSYGPCSSPTVYTGLADGAYTFFVRAVGPTGLIDPTPATYSFTVTSPTAAPPVITSPAENAWIASSTLTLSGTAGAGLAVTVYEGSSVRASTTASLTGAWSVQISGVQDGTHTYTARAGNSAPSAPRTVRVDATAPAAPLITDPVDGAWNASSSLQLRGTAEPESTVEVREGTTTRGAVTASASGTWTLSLSGVADGTHTYVARATDQAGNVSPNSAPRVVRVDTQPPQTSITLGPTGTVTGTSVTFAFASSESGSTFECRLDGPAGQGSYQPCTSPRSYATTVAGSYTFRVRASDLAGNVDPTPASRSFTVSVPTPSPTPSSTPTATPTPSPTPTATPVNIVAQAIWETPTGAVVGQPTTFDGCSSKGNPPLVYEWSWGPYSSEVWATTCRATFTFNVVGEKVVSLRVTDADGETSNVVKYFSVGAAPAPTPTATATPNPTPSATATPNPSPTATATPNPTPTATPTSTPSAGRNCMPDPSVCGYPDLESVGVQPGKSLTPVSGTVTLSQAGQVYENRVVTGNIVVTAPNVTIRNVRLINRNQSYAISVKNRNSWETSDANLLLEHVEIDLGGYTAVKGVAFNGYTARNVFFRNGSDCAHFGVNVVIEDSLCVVGPDSNRDGWPDSTSFCSGPEHFDGFQSDGGNNITLRHNTVRIPCSQTSAILMSSNTSPIRNVTITDNLLAGGGYTLYCAGSADGTRVSNIVATNNRFAKTWFPRGGYWGPTAYCQYASVFSGNIWDDTLTSITS